MKCKFHPNNEAQAICQKCKNPICEDCTVMVDGKIVCQHCVQHNLFSPEPLTSFKRPSSERFLFFVCSLIPGAAHMHLGLFRRGLQLMLIVFGTIALASFINLDLLIPVAVIPTWFFSFFESHNLNKQLWQGQPLCDKDIFNQSLFGDFSMLKNPRIVGISIIVVGVLGLLQVVGRSSEVIMFFGKYYYMVRSSLMPVLLILSGIYLLTKAKQSTKVSDV